MLFSVALAKTLPIPVPLASVRAICMPSSMHMLAPGLHTLDAHAKRGFTVLSVSFCLLPRSLQLENKYRYQCFSFFMQVCITAWKKQMAHVPNEISGEV